MSRQLGGRRHVGRFSHSKAGAAGEAPPLAPDPPEELMPRGERGESHRLSRRIGDIRIGCVNTGSTPTKREPILVGYRSNPYSEIMFGAWFGPAARRGPGGKRSEALRSREDGDSSRA